MRRGLSFTAATCVALGTITSGIVGPGAMANATPKATLEFRHATVAEPPSDLPCRLVPQNPRPDQAFRACGPDHRTVYALSAAALTTTPRAATADRPQGGQWVVTVTLNPGAAEMLRRYTATHVGSQLAFVHAGRVLTAPVIRDGFGSPVQITGLADQQSAVQLATELKG
ncbi:hypothetical protein FK268_16925 [Tsukamurella sputi]|uniref:SecDF P1 head subdomain domain-containing protein n=1 Tax=Tsukamurella sputi TaxID=2591848 RepID=A0A5C5RJ96_9ACTN|nr:hypothetical protein [Tsukamurella sputi]TWS23069.1 hypothetical protein FK268_16925 [Tsukamurella sputi]